MALPTLNSAHAYVWNRTAGAELYALDENTQSRFASLTKLWSLGQVLRGLYPTQAALEAIDVTVDADADAVGGSGANDSNVGDVWSGFGCVQGAMYSSSNELTDAVTRYAAANDLGASGTVTQIRQAYLDEMASQATTAGLVATTFGTSHGGPGAAESGTAKELAAIMSLVCDWSVFRTIWAAQNVSTSTAVSITRNGEPWIENISSGLGIHGDEGVLGAKGGQGGGTHMASLWQAPRGDEIVIITLNASSGAERDADHRAIIAQLPIDYPALTGNIRTRTMML